MSKIRLQAHRGVSSEFPENTFAAFQAAIDEGYDIIELDPKYTADNHIVILHDRTVNRTGRRQDGSTLPPDTAIKDLTFAQARELEYGSWKDPKFKGEKLPSLEELIDFIKAHDIPFKFDNVWETFPPEQQEIFLSQLEKANLGSKTGFTCRKPECFVPQAGVLRACRQTFSASGAPLGRRERQGDIGGCREGRRRPPPDHLGLLRQQADGLVQRRESHRGALRHGPSVR